MMQILKESVKNMQEYKTPPCDVSRKNKIGGGNGKVGFVLEHEDGSPPLTVAPTKVGLSKKFRICHLFICLLDYL